MTSESGEVRQHPVASIKLLLCGPVEIMCAWHRQEFFLPDASALDAESSAHSSGRFWVLAIRKSIRVDECGELSVVEVLFTY